MIKRFEKGIWIDGRYMEDHFPGIGRYTYCLIDALARVAREDKFIVLHNPGLKNTRYDLASLARYPNIELVRSNIPTRSWREQFSLNRMISATTQGRPRLYHSPYFLKPYRLRVPSLVTIFDLIPLHASQGASVSARWFFRAAIAAAVRTSARVIVPSISARNDLVAALHLAPEKATEKITVTRLAADARFKPTTGPETKRVREKYALPGRYILSVGINKPHKNLATLVAAWERAEVDAGLVIAGAWDVRYGSEIKSQDSIRFLHDVEEADLAALYSGATVFVFPSFYEGFGLPVLEAMACGAPVISSNASSLPEVGGDAPLYFDPRDVDTLAQSIARVAGDGALQDEMRARSSARAKVFSWEQTARETLTVYRSLEANRQVKAQNEI